MNNIDSLTVLGGSLERLVLPAATENPRAHGQIAVSENSILSGVISEGALVWAGGGGMSDGLFPFTEHLFTAADTYGRQGPGRGVLVNAYAGAEWPVNDTAIFDVSSGTQIFTVPANGRYALELHGATPRLSPGLNGGRTRRICVRGEVDLLAGQKLHIMCGQPGQLFRNGNFDTMAFYVGAGCTSVRIEGEAEPLLVAAGVGGTHDSGQTPLLVTSWDRAYISNPGVQINSAQTPGNAGVTLYNSNIPSQSQGGGGWKQPAAWNFHASFTSYNYPSALNVNGFAASVTHNDITAQGGFGGGGIGLYSSVGSFYYGGGGGGYSGGAASNASVYRATPGACYKSPLIPNATITTTESTIVHGSVLLRRLS